MRAALAGPDVTVTTAEAGVLDVEGLDAAAIGQVGAVVAGGRSMRCGPGEPSVAGPSATDDYQ